MNGGHGHGQGGRMNASRSWNGREGTAWTYHKPWTPMRGRYNTPYRNYPRRYPLHASSPLPPHLQGRISPQPVAYPPPVLQSQEGGDVIGPPAGGMLTRVLEGDEGNRAPVIVSSREKMRRAKDLWDLRWNRWWGYNWHRKREETIRKQRTQTRRQERLENVNSFRKMDVNESENVSKEDSCRADVKSSLNDATDGEKTESSSECQDISKCSSRPVRLLRHIHRKYINSSARIQILHLTKLTKAFFQKHFKLRRRKKSVVENLIDLESVLSQDLTPPLFPVRDDEVEPQRTNDEETNHEEVTSMFYDQQLEEYQTEMIELRNNIQMFSQTPLDRFSCDVRSNELKTSFQNIKRQTSDSSLKSMEYLTKRLEHLQKLDDWNETDLNEKRIHQHTREEIVKDQLKPTKLVSFQVNNTKKELDMKGKMPTPLTSSDGEKNSDLGSMSKNSILFPSIPKNTFDDTKSIKPIDYVPNTSPLPTKHPFEMPKLSPIKLTVKTNNPLNEHLQHQIETFNEYSSAQTEQNDLNLFKNDAMKRNPSSSSLYLDSFSRCPTTIPYLYPQYYNKYHHLFHQSPYFNSHAQPTWTNSVSTQTEEHILSYQTKNLTANTINTPLNTLSTFNRSISTQTVEPLSDSSVQQCPGGVFHTVHPISKLVSSPKAIRTDRTTSTHFWANSATQTNSCTRLKHHRPLPNSNCSESVSHLFLSNVKDRKKSDDQPSHSECNLYSDCLSCTNIPERLESVSFDIIFDKKNIHPPRSKSHSGVRFNLQSDFPNKVLPEIALSDIPNFETLLEPALKRAIDIVNNEIMKPKGENIVNGNNATLTDCDAILSDKLLQSLENLNSLTIEDKAKIIKNIES